MEPPSSSVRERPSEPTGPAASDAAIEVRNVSFAYPGQLVLRDVSFEVARGEFVSIIGPSGCGKSTLLLIIAGLLKPSRGSVLTRGQPVHGPGDDRAMVFQDFALMPWKTALDNVIVAMRYRRSEPDRDAMRRRAEHYVRLVGLEGFGHRFPHELSGGMRQRVGLARAFAARADILLMDEPFASIDAQNAEIMREELRDLVAREARTIIFVTHNLDEALFLSDRILMLSANPGQISEDAAIDLPQPRGFDVADEGERLRYADYRARLWDHLRREVARSEPAAGQEEERDG